MSDQDQETQPQPPQTPQIEPPPATPVVAETPRAATNDSGATNDPPATNDPVATNSEAPPQARQDDRGRNRQFRNQRPPRQPRRQGERNQDPRNEGSRSEGSRDEGSRDEGSRREGSKDEGSRGEGSRREGSRREGSRSEGSRGEGSRREGSRSEGSRNDGQHQRQGGLEVSIVIPLLNEDQSIRELYEQIKDAMHRNNRYEIIFVDDGSTDTSARVIAELRNRDRRVKLIRFRRNFGKSAALSVGFAHAEGQFVVTMDADLQDDPDEIPNLISELKKGFDLVSGWKKKRRDPITKTIPSRFFNFVTSVMTGIRIHDFNCGLKGYRREVVKEVKVYGELHRYIPVLANSLGFKIGEIPVKHRARKYGKTKFGMGRFWKGFLDLLTALFTTRYLQRPLHLFGFWGLISFAAGVGIDGYLTYLKFVDGISLSNRPLFIGGILLIIVGVQSIAIGLIGEIISKTRANVEREYSIREILK